MRWLKRSFDVCKMSGRLRFNSSSIAQTVQKVTQDLVAPDVRELKTL